MRPLFAAALVTMISFSPALAQTIEITPNGSAPSAVGTPDQFTGQVVVPHCFPRLTTHARPWARSRFPLGPEPRGIRIPQASC